MRKIFIALLLVIMAVSLAAADTIYLRDGRVIRGTVLGFIDGQFVIRLDNAQAAGQTNTGDNIQYFNPQDIQRIEIDGRSLDEARFQTHTVTVTLGPDWIDSGVFVRRGQRVRVRASGIIEAGRNRISPAGLRSTDPDAPLPNAPEGELIGAIGNDPSAPIIEFGAGREFVADNDGDIFLTVNRGNYADARGAYNVQILTERTFPTNPAISSSNNPVGMGNQPSNNPSVVGSTPRQKTVTVPADSQGTDTGIDLHAGDQVTVTATGTIVAGGKVGSVGPDGGQARGFGAVLGEVVGAYPIPNAGIGALGGYIQPANGQINGPFLIGSQKTFTAPVDGRLFLMINDIDYSNHSGSFTATIRY